MPATSVHGTADVLEGVKLLTIVVGQNEAPFGSHAEHGSGLVKGEVVGAPGASRLAGKLEGRHMVCIHPII